MAHHFDVVPVRPDDEGGVIVRVVLRPQARRTVVPAARPQGRAMEGIDLLATFGRERQMQVRRLLLGLADAQRRRIAGAAQLDGDATVAEYAGKAQSHLIENVAKSPYQLFAVENLKTSGWSTGASASGLATKMIQESRAFRLYDINLSTDTSQTSHTHAVPTVAVLISGLVMSDGPDTQAKANPGAPVGLKQLTQPGQWILIPSGDTHHIVRLGVGNARVVEIEVR